MVKLEIRYVEVNGKKYSPGDTIRVTKGSEVEVKPVVCLVRDSPLDPTAVGGTLEITVETDGAKGTTSGNAGYGCYTAPFKWKETRSGELKLVVKANFNGMGMPSFPVPTPIIIYSEQAWRYVIEEQKPAPPPAPGKPGQPIPTPIPEFKVPWTTIAIIGAVGAVLLGIALALRR